MPAKGFLNQEQREKLQQAVRQGNCPGLREHALILLLQNYGKTYQEIQKFIGCGYRTVAYPSFVTFRIKQVVNKPVYPEE